MRREIKFRAFEDGKMYYSDSQEDAELLGAKLGGSIICAFFNIFYGHSTLGQFTGLLDKNGREIYDGDILKWKCSKSGSSKDKIHTVSIHWDSHNYSLTIYDKGEKWATQKSYWNAEHREVIGNLHEHPNLVTT